MNKLFCIKFVIGSGEREIVMYRNFWDEAAALEKMKKNPEWTFTLIEDNQVHKIWEAR